MRTIHHLRALAVAALFAASAAVVPAEAALLRLTLVHVNGCNQMAGIKGAGGAAKIATVAAEERAKDAAEGGHVVLTFGGDMISPSLLSVVRASAQGFRLA